MVTRAPARDARSVREVAAALLADLDALRAACEPARLPPAQRSVYEQFVRHIRGARAAWEQLKQM